MSSSSSSVIRCSAHPDARAAWECSGCGAHLCPRCAADDMVQRISVVRCLSCGAVAQPLKVRKEIKSFLSMIPDFLLAIFSGRGLLHLAVLGLLLTLSGFLAVIPFLGWLAALAAYFGLYATYYFLIIREAVAGNPQAPPATHFTDNAIDVLLCAVRFLLGAAVVWVPAIIYLWGPRMVALAADPMSALSDPVLLLIAGFGLLYFPAAMITAATTESTIAMFNPLMILGIIVRIPKHYVGAALLWGILFVGRFFLRAKLFAALMPAFSITGMIGKMWLTESVCLTLPVLSAFVLGWVIYQNGEVLGVLTQSDLWTLAQPNARPAGVLPPGGFPKGRGKPAPAAANVTAPAAAVAPQAASAPTQELRQALTGAPDKALEVYRRLAQAGLAPELEPAEELKLAALLDQAGDARGAVLACRRAAKREPTGPLAPRALFTAARLLAERMQKPADAEAMFQYLIKTFPAHELAGKARQFLSRLAGQPPQ